MTFSTTTDDCLTLECARQHLGEQVPGFFPTLAAALGTSMKELNESLERGEVSKTAALAALAALAIARATPQPQRETMSINEPKNKAETLRSAIAALVTDYEKSTGIYVESLSIRIIEVTTSESTAPEFIRRVEVEFKKPPSAGVS